MERTLLAKQSNQGGCEFGFNETLFWPENLCGAASLKILRAFRLWFSARQTLFAQGRPIKSRRLAKFGTLALLLDRFLFLKSKRTAIQTRLQLLNLNLNLNQKSIVFEVVNNMTHFIWDCLAYGSLPNFPESLTCVQKSIARLKCKTGKDSEMSMRQFAEMRRG